MNAVDPDRFMAVLEKHSASVTLSLLCDLLPILGLRLSAKPAIATEAGTAETENTGSVHEGASPEGIAQPQSVSGLSHTGGDRG